MKSTISNIKLSPLNGSVSSARGAAWSITTALLIASATLFAGCEGGGIDTKTGEGGNGNPVPSDAAASSGPVTGVSPLGVAGTSLDAANVNALLNAAGSRPSTELRLGMTVDASADLFTGTTQGKAKIIVAQSAVRGPVSAIDSAAQRVTAVGIVTQLDQNTILENFPSLTALKLGDRIEVYGLQQAKAGRIQATRVTLLKDAATDTVEVLGIATDTTSTTSIVNGVSVTTTSAQVVLPNGVALSAPLPPNTVVAANTRVRIVGTLNSAGNITATQIIAGLSPTRDVGAIVSIDGIVGIMNPPVAGMVQIGEDKIDISGLPVATAATIAPGFRVQIRGRKQDTFVRATEGRAFANTERFEYRVEGVITDFTSAASFKVAGETISALTATFTNGATADLGVGKKVRIKGVAGAGVIEATEVTLLP
jgi:Domain of unknown function (DUF5666)